MPELADGVESDTQLALFAAEGCNEVLGYLIGDRSRLFVSTCHQELDFELAKGSLWRKAGVLFDRD